MTAQQELGATLGEAGQTVALVLALILGGVGLLSILGFFMYSSYRLRRERRERRSTLSPQQRRHEDRLTLLVWFAAAVTVVLMGGLQRADR